MKKNPFSGVIKTRIYEQINNIIKSTRTIYNYSRFVSKSSN